MCVGVDFECRLNERGVQIAKWRSADGEYFLFFLRREVNGRMEGERGA